VTIDAAFGRLPPQPAKPTARTAAMSEYRRTKRAS
jgi:hypothetical protein